MSVPLAKSLILAIQRFPGLSNANKLSQTWNFPVVVFEDFLLRLFEKYAELLKRRFSDDFQEVRKHFRRNEFLVFSMVSFSFLNPKKGVSKWQLMY